MKQPSYIKALTEAGITEAEFRDAQAFYDANGWQLVPKYNRRGWTGDFMLSRCSDRWTRCTMGLGVTIDAIRDCNAKLNDAWEMAFTHFEAWSPGAN